METNIDSNINQIQINDIESKIRKMNLSEPGSIEEALRMLDEDDAKIDIELEEALSRRHYIEAEMSTMKQTLGTLQIIESEVSKLVDQIANSAELAENVSSKVKKLDVARSQIEECQKKVDDLIDLQVCSQGVITAIKEEDFETGANCIKRYLAMDKNLLEKSSSNSDDDSSNSVNVNDVNGSISGAIKTLETATIKMRELISQKFDEAVRKDDLASVERFFKIYAQIGMQSEGIEKFSKYICQKLESKSQKELRNSLDIAKAEKRLPVAFADTMTTLLENFARVIEVNQPIIEQCYGHGYLIQMFQILQKECDSEIQNVLLEFSKNRKISLRIAQINEYIKGGVSSQQGHYRKSSGSLDKLNPKDIDSNIVEITIMHSRAELYYRFMRRKLMNDIETIEDDTKKSELQAKSEDLVNKSEMNRQMQELLGTYLLFERYFMEESVLKAIGLDNFEAGQQCSSMVDEVFFILRKSLRRSITSQSINGICAVINNATSCFESDFINALKQPLKSGYPSGYIDLAQAYNVIQSTIQQGKIQTSDSEQARTNFLVQLNNADMSTEYIETLCTAMSEEIYGAFPQMTKIEKQMIDSCMQDLRSVKDSLKAVVDFGLQQLRSSAIKPRLNPWIDQFLNHNHHMTEEELLAYEAGETFVQFLIVQIDGLLNSFKSVLSSRNYDGLVSILATDVTARLERAIKKSTFNRLGGLVLDQEVRALGTYLTGATSWSVRDKLARLTQIATLLNLESVAELSDYWNPNENTNMPWRITPNEVKTILTLRSDFRMDDIKRIKI